MTTIRHGRALAFVLIAILLLCLVGCGGGGGNGGENGGDDGSGGPSAIPEGTVEYTLANNVVALDSGVQTAQSSGHWQGNDPVVTVPEIADITPTSFRIVGASPDLEPGQIVVNKENEGFLRRVESVASTGDGLLVNTSDASLEELFEHASINKLTAVSEFGQIETPDYAEVIDIGTMAMPAQSKWTGQIAYFTIHVDHELASNAQGSVRLYGDLTVSVPVEFYLDIQWMTLRRMYATIGIVSNGTLGVQGSYESSVWNCNREVLLATFYGGPIPIGPVVLVPEVRLYADVDAGVTVRAEFDVCVDATLEARAGPEYKDGNFGIRTVPEDLADVLTFDVSGTFGGEVKGDLQVRPLVMRAALKLYGAAGPYVDIGCGGRPASTTKQT